MAINSTGLLNFEIYYRPVKNRQYRTTVAYLSELRINDPDIGVLMPKDYREVSERSEQCEKLALYAFEQVVEDIRRFEARGLAFEWVSVYIPERLLLKKDFHDLLGKVLDDGLISPDELCLEIPFEILFSDLKKIAAAVKKIKSMGVNFLLSSVGRSLDPIMKLSDLDLDYVIADREVIDSLKSKDERKVKMTSAFFTYAESGGTLAIAGSVRKEEELALLPDGISLYEGKAAGSPKKALYIRN